MRKRKKLRLKEKMNFKEEMEPLDGKLCEMCSTNPSEGLYWIQNSHPFSEYPHKMELCKWCCKGLTDANVRVKKVETNA